MINPFTGKGTHDCTECEREIAYTEKDLDKNGDLTCTCGHVEDFEPTEAQLQSYYYGGSSPAERRERDYRELRELGRR